ncbi:MAG: hypothetical protein ACREAZ_07065 [Nitrososphaera sp.]
MSLDNIPVIVWAHMATIIATIGGIFSIISHIDKKIASLKMDVCDEIKEVKRAIGEVKEDTERLKDKLSEHLIVSSQSSTQLEHLKERLDAHESELDEMQRVLQG